MNPWKKMGQKKYNEEADRLEKALEESNTKNTDKPDKPDKNHLSDFNKNDSDS